MSKEVEAHILSDDGDRRGGSWQIGSAIDYLSVIGDIHLMTLNPGSVRGNHFHRRKREILIIEHAGEWMLFSDNAQATEVRTRRFDQAGVVAVVVPPGCAHAVENLGGGPMRIIGISDHRYDPGDPDAYPRILRRVG